MTDLEPGAAFFRYLDRFGNTLVTIKYSITGMRRIKPASFTDPFDKCNNFLGRSACLVGSIFQACGQAECTGVQCFVDPITHLFDLIPAGRAVCHPHGTRTDGTMSNQWDDINTQVPVQAIQILAECGPIDFNAMLRTVPQDVLLHSFSIYGRRRAEATVSQHFGSQTLFNGAFGR